MKIYLVVWGVLVSIMCSTGILTAQDDSSDGGVASSEGQAESPPAQAETPAVAPPGDAIDDLDGLDDLDREIYGLDDLDQELDSPAPQTTDDLDDLDVPADKRSEDAPAVDDILDEPAANDAENTAQDVLLDPADAQQMRQLEIDISIHPADVIMLRSGETVEGVIRKKTDDFVAIETETGLHSYPLSEIEFMDEISEEERFYLLDKIQALQAFNKRAMEKELAETKQQLDRDQRTAEAKTETINRITGKDETGLYNLTHVRLEEIIKDFSQFSPDYWRYYHRKHDAQKAILRLNRLRRYAHVEIVDLIDQYIRAFETKIKEFNEPAGSRLIDSYRDNYKKIFSKAEQRRNVLKGAEFH